MNARKRLFAFLFAALSVLLFTACGKWDYSREAVKAANEAQGDTLRVEFKVNQTFTNALRAAAEDNIQPADVDKAMTMDKSIAKLLTSGYRLDVYALRADIDADKAAAQLADEFVNRLAGCEDEGFISMVKAENGYFYEAVLVYKHNSGSSGGGDGSSDPEVKPEPDPEPEPVEYAVTWDNEKKILTCGSTSKGVTAYDEMESYALTEEAVKTALEKQGDKALEGFSLGNVKKLVIEYNSGVTSIGDNAFGSFPTTEQTKNTTLQEITLSGVTSIGKESFANCVELTNIIDSGNVRTIGLRSFFHCEKLKSVTMPYLLTISNDMAFAECSQLETVSMPLVKKIPNQTFRDCTNLSSVTLTNATTIEGYAFWNCTNKLTEIYLPAATELGFGAFLWCDSLTSIKLPKVVKITADAFERTGKSAGVLTIYSENIMDETSFAQKISVVDQDGNPITDNNEKLSCVGLDGAGITYNYQASDT